MPGKKHVKEWSEKRNRQYEHVLKSLREQHPDWSEDKLKEMAARTVNKTRAEKGETKKSTEEKWIQKAIKRPGQLHRDLGVPEDEEIPASKLQQALKSKSPKVKRRAQLALNLKKLRNKRKKSQVEHNYNQQSQIISDDSNYNPVVDGPNPDGPNYLNNAENSFEQQVALQTWVNFAVELLNAGNSDEVVLAKLAHAGCPNPQDVLIRAKMQPFKEEDEEEEKPVTDEIGQDPFTPLPSDSDVSSDYSDSVLQQQRPLSKVRVIGSSFTGTVIDQWSDPRGESLYRVALDEGGVINVAPAALEEIDEPKVTHPVDQIENFINNLPEVKPSRPYIEARLANLEIAKRSIQSVIGKLGFADQIRLDRIHSDIQDEIFYLREALNDFTSPRDLEYLGSLPAYRTHALDIPGVSKVKVQNAEFDNKIDEKAAIFVSELPEEMIKDQQVVAYAAAQYASSNNGDVERFMKLVEEKRTSYLAENS